MLRCTNSLLQVHTVNVGNLIYSMDRINRIICTSKVWHFKYLILLINESIFFLILARYKFLGSNSDKHTQPSLLWAENQRHCLPLQRPGPDGSRTDRENSSIRALGPRVWARGQPQGTGPERKPRIFTGESACGTPTSYLQTALPQTSTLGV